MTNYGPNKILYLNTSYEMSLSNQLFSLLGVLWHFADSAPNASGKAGGPTCVHESLHLAWTLSRDHNDINALNL